MQCAHKHTACQKKLNWAIARGTPSLAKRSQTKEDKKSEVSSDTASVHVRRTSPGIHTFSSERGEDRCTLETCYAFREKREACLRPMHIYLFTNTKNLILICVCVYITHDASFSYGITKDSRNKKFSNFDNNERT